MSSRQRERIALVGFMATGKSTFAQILARRLGWAYVDCDALIARREKRTIVRIFAESGEPYFRRAETRVLRTALKRKRCVVATGGGAILAAANRRALARAAFVIWMRSPLAAVLKRTAAKTDRPLLNAPDRSRVARELLRKRTPLYRACADAQVTTVSKADLKKNAEIFLQKYGYAPRR